MNVGKPKRTYTVEPLRDPVPHEKPSPASPELPQRPLPAREDAPTR